MSKGKEPSWNELLSMKSGTVVLDRFDEGLRFIVMRGPVALCAYIGVPLAHPLAGHSYENLPVRAHYGLSYANQGDNSSLPEGMFWYGWDYGHSGDVCFYDQPAREREKKWLVKDVVSDSWETIYDFKKLMLLVETVANRGVAQ